MRQIDTAKLRLANPVAGGSDGRNRGQPETDLSQASKLAVAAGQPADYRPNEWGTKRSRTLEFLI